MAIRCNTSFEEQSKFGTWTQTVLALEHLRLLQHWADSSHEVTAQRQSGLQMMSQDGSIYTARCCKHCVCSTVWSGTGTTNPLVLKHLLIWLSNLRYVLRSYTTIPLLREVRHLEATDKLRTKTDCLKVQFLVLSVEWNTVGAAIVCANIGFHLKVIK